MFVFVFVYFSLKLTHSEIFLNYLHQCQRFIGVKLSRVSKIVTVFRDSKLIRNETAHLAMQVMC